MLKKIAVIGLLTFGAMSLVLAAESIQGGVGNVQSAEAAALGQAGCRYYSTFGSDAGINNNVATCTNIRCLRPYATFTGWQPGGYYCQGEGTAAYNSDSNNQTMYLLVDAEANAGTANHIGYFAVAGQVVSNAGVVNTGDPRLANCGGTQTTINCFTRMDTSNSLSTPLASTYASWPTGTNTIAAMGGFSPNPTVRAAYPGSGCAAGEARLTWDDPNAYTGSMKNSVASPVLGVKIYKSGNTCANPPVGDIVAGGWSAVGSYGPGAGSTGICVPITADTWFATTVRMRGPSSTPTEIETGVVGGAGFVGANSQCVAKSPTAVLIAGVSAKYAGRGTVDVTFKSGSQAGVTGYYVQRAKNANGPWETVSQMVAPTGDGSTYNISDKVKSSLGRVTYYRVQVEMNDGTKSFSGSTAVSMPAQRLN